MAEVGENGGQQAAEQPVFHVEKLYLKDFSYESPNSPAIFKESEEPKVEFNLDTSANKMGETGYEVTLHVTTKVTVKDKLLFLIEVSYAGLFVVRNVPEPQVPMLIGIECPNILFPYVRQLVSHAVTEGGFKPLVLDPINFAAVYHQAQARKQAEGQPTVN
ncbi:MAG: protein-export chaperone SecB [Magnetococcales bacterium]|nr:protein-export chaperone SecB [Magnetococcales bacterium]